MCTCSGDDASTTVSSSGAIARFERAICAFPETAPEWLDNQRAGWHVRPSRFRLVARCYRPDLSVDWLRSQWYWTLADTDLV